MGEEIYLPAARPFFNDEDTPYILNEIKDVLKSGRLILGPYTQRFEKLFKEYIGVKYAISVNSCTTAMEITLKYLNVKDKEVIVPTNTFIASANSVIYAGGKPILADINPDSLCIDPEDVIKKLTHKTKGIIVVHIAGLVCPHMKELKEICEENKLFLVEDAAHAHGAMIDDKKAGSISDVGCFSFYPTKVMTTCTGGMITTNDSDLTDYAKSVRHHGQGKSLEDIKMLGNDWCMDEISAILGTYQLKGLEESIKRRNEIAKSYTKGVKKIKNITSFPVPPNIRHSYYKYATLLDEDIDKKELIRSLRIEHNIEAGTLYDPPCHLQPVYRDIFGYKEGMFPTAEKILKSQLCLPIFAQMTDEKVDYVLKCLKKEI